MYQEIFMQRAIELSATALTQAGHEPFAAVIVRDGQIVGEGVNRSRIDCDPTSHGEIEAIRDACRRLRTVDLRGCALYSSCEPCALCVAAMVLAGITRLYYAAGLVEANTALADLPAEARFTVDADHLRQQAGRRTPDQAMPSSQHEPGAAMDVIKTWAAALRVR